VSQQLPPATIAELCRGLAKKLDHYNWQRLARPKQIPPGEPGSSSPRKDWLYWFLMTGRGFGKTRTGAETVRAQVETSVATIS
jgi:phage terminase large subunit-like protein